MYMQYMPICISLCVLKHREFTLTPLISVQHKVVCPPLYIFVMTCPNDENLAPIIDSYPQYIYFFVQV